MDDVLRRRMFLVKADVDLPDEVLRGLRSAPLAELGFEEGALERAARAVGLGGARLERREAGGTFHRLYDARGVEGEPLMRVALLGGAPWAGLMEMESRLATYLRGRGFPVPGCRFAREGARGVQRVERVAGEAASARDDDEAVTVARLESVARFLARLHAIRGKGFGPVRMEDDGPRGLFDSWEGFLQVRLADHVAACADSGAVTRAEAARIEDLFARARYEAVPALLHGDPGGHNFMVEGAELVGVIDWEDALLGDPLFDLASLCTFQPPRRHARVIAAYGAALEPGTAAWRSFWLYFLRISLAKTVHRHRFGYGDVAGRPPASARIQAALGSLASHP